MRVLEFTGTKYPKARHRFTLGSRFIAVAGLWREAPGNKPPTTFKMLTTDPGPDVAPCHNRQVVVLQPKSGRPGSV